MDDCKLDHDLEEVYRVSYSGYDEVVRWCVNCGAIVVDVESDNRLNPGGVFKMKFPKKLKQLKR